MKRYIYSLIVLVLIIAFGIILAGCSVHPGSIYENKDISQMISEYQQIYRGVELVNKPLSEIIKITGERFEVKKGYKTIYYTSPVVCIYSESVLPGFVFYIDAATKDYDNGKDVKANIISGKYGSFDFLGIFDGAVFDERINTNMKYNDVSKAIGSYVAKPSAGSGAMVQQITYSDGTKVPNATVFYKNAEGLPTTKKGNETVFDEESAKKHNPSIYGIVVFPDNKPATPQPAESSRPAESSTASNPVKKEPHSDATLRYTKYEGVRARSDINVNDSKNILKTLGAVNTVVYLLGDKKGDNEGYTWYYVDYPDGSQWKQGWIRDDCLTVTKNPESSSAVDNQNLPHSNATRRYTNAVGVRVRSEANTANENNILKYLGDVNTEVYLLGAETVDNEGRTWYYIDYLDGTQWKQGWVWDGCLSEKKV